MMGGRSSGDDPAGAGEASLRALAGCWTAGLARAVYLPMSRTELHTLLTAAASGLVDAATARPVDLASARQAGMSLVEADLLDAGVLPATVTALGSYLPLAAAARSGSPDAALAVQAAVVEGYVSRLRTRILDEQESVHRAGARARREIEAALRDSEARFRAVFVNAGIGIGIADMAGQIVEVNRAFAAMLGFTVEEFRRLRVDSFVEDAADTPRVRDLYEEIIAGRRERACIEHPYRHRDGHQVWTDLTVSLIRDAHGAPLYTVALVEDITTRRELQQRLRHQAHHDPLTQLPNRTLFQQRLAAVFARPGSRVGVCYLDLDQFKAVNDRLGHDVGDALLVTVGSRLDAVVAARGHLVARMGGDEFVVLVEDPPRGELALLADTVLAVLAEPVVIDDHVLHVGASIGVVDWCTDDATPAEVLKAADVTLYWAKSDGRNRWAAFDPDRNAREMTRYTIAATLLPGLDRDEFRVEYQPIVDLSDGRVSGVEALVRWAHPNLGLLGPDQFISLAEETGAIIPLGRHVLAHACRRTADWNASHAGADLFVSVNLAVRQAHEPDLVEDVLRILARTGLAPRLLQLEVTESALLGPAGRPIDAIRALADAGVRIAVDDFGTGYSNLGYLPRLPLHTLKLAGALIEGLREAAPSGSPIVTSLISLAHALGLTVTAEAVETTTQADRLRAAGCDLAQGWLYARPSKWTDIVRLLDHPIPENVHRG